MSEVDDQVRAMAKMVVLSGRISDVHEKNMKAYPFIFFDGIKGMKIEYDLTNKSDIDESSKQKIVVKAPIRNHFVAYYLDIDNQVQNQNMDRRCTTLESAIRSLFWKDVILKIYINDKLIYESKKNE